MAFAVTLAARQGGRAWPVIAFDASTRRAAGEPDDRLRSVADGVLATGETS